MVNRFRKKLQKFGPGIIFASTAIGVSHLVQSTRAGAEYGFTLIIFILMANIFKYPFFEFGTRYAYATKESLIEGYSRIGKWVLISYLMITILSMFTVIAAVGFVCSGLISQITGYTDLRLVIILLFVVCFLILFFGRYVVLEDIIKLISSILLLSTLSAFIVCVINGPTEVSDNFIRPVLSDKKSILFIIALMGWMPTAVDLSTWNSIWTIEKLKVSKNSFREIMFDFRFGYFITIILSLFFLTLGCYLMFGSGEEIPNSSSLFATKLISLYTITLGDWSYLLISICAFSVMFSTTVSVIDGYSRSMSLTLKNLINVNSDRCYFGWLLVSCFLPIIIIFNFMNDFKKLIDLATTISFIIAPFCAILNHYLINSKFVSQKFKPSRYLNVLSYSGIVFLVAFCIIYFTII